VPAGGAAIVEFRADVPGEYTLVDHSIFRAMHRGAMGTLVVEGTGGEEIFAAGAQNQPYDPAEVAE